MRASLALTAGLVLLTAAGLGRCDQPSPLRLLPAGTDFYVQIREPHKAVPLVQKHDLVAKARKLAFVKDKLDSVAFRRAMQMLTHAEQKMNAEWPAMLEKLASGGVVLGGKYGDKAPVLLVMQGGDEAATKRFVSLAVEVLDEELARQESKERVVKRAEKDHDSYQIGPEFFAARLGSALVVSNDEKTRDAAVALYRKQGAGGLGDDARVKDAAKLLPKAPLADAWFDLSAAHKAEGGKKLFETPRDDFQLTLLFGAYFDVLGRSPYAAAALTHDDGAFELTVRAPRGREGMGPDRALHLFSDDQPGAQTPLTPKGTMYSTSFTFDFAKVWQDRDKLFTAANAKGLADFDKQSAWYLLGTNRASALLESAGRRHRYVHVMPTEPSGYGRKPKTPVTSFAVVSETSAPDKFFGTTSFALRTVGLGLSFQYGLSRRDERYEGVEIVGWRFDEKKPLAGDENDSRFGYSPCFARVGRQFVVSSTVELCRDLIDELHAERTKKVGQQARYKSRDRFCGAGLAAYLEAREDEFVTKAMLEQGIDAAEARKQVREVAAFVKGVGDVTSWVDFQERRTEYTFRLGK